MSDKESVYRTKYAYEGGKSFNIFIIDRLMPDMNGVEVVILITNKTIDKKSSYNPYMQDYARFFV